MLKLKKKAIDEEGGEKRRMTIYKWIGKKSENDLEEVVGDLIYKNERKK